MSAPDAQFGVGLEVIDGAERHRCWFKVDNFKQRILPRWKPASQEDWKALVYCYVGINSSKLEKVHVKLTTRRVILYWDLKDGPTGT